MPHATSHSCDLSIWVMHMHMHCMRRPCTAGAEAVDDIVIRISPVRICRDAKAMCCRSDNFTPLQHPPPPLTVWFALTTLSHSAAAHRIFSSSIPDHRLVHFAMLVHVLYLLQPLTPFVDVMRPGHRSPYKRCQNHVQPLCLHLVASSCRVCQTCRTSVSSIIRTRTSLSPTMSCSQLTAAQLRPRCPPGVLPQCLANGWPGEVSMPATLPGWCLVLHVICCVLCMPHRLLCCSTGTVQGPRDDKGCMIHPVTLSSRVELSPEEQQDVLSAFRHIVCENNLPSCSTRVSVHAITGLHVCDQYAIISSVCLSVCLLVCSSA
jgi:hypothetical protein